MKASAHTHDPILHGNGRLEKWECRVGVVMRAGTQMGPLRDGDLRADGYWTQVVDHRILAYSTMIADGEVPREVDRRRVIDMDILSHLGPKAAQDKPAPAESRARAEAKEELPYAPQHTAHHLRPGVFAGVAIGRNVE